MIIIKIEDIDIKKLLQELENNAWENKGETKAYLICENDIVEMYAYTYEPCYELFSTTHTIKLNGEALLEEDAYKAWCEHFHKPRTYKAFKNTEEKISFLENRFKDKEIILQYGDLKEQCKQQEEEEEF